MKKGDNTKIRIAFAAKLTEACVQSLHAEHDPSQYQAFFSGLCRHEQLPLTVHMTGSFFQFIQKKNSPYPYLINNLLGSKRLELLSGGFYQPYLPLLPQADVISQIELLTSTLREHVIKRPRGCFLEASAWSAALIPSLVKAGMEYCLLDYRLFEASDMPATKPAVLEDSSKCLVALPYRELTIDTPAETFYAQLVARYGDTPGTVLIFMLPLDCYQKLFFTHDNASTWFKTFIQYVQKPNSPFRLTHTGEIYKEPPVCLGYIASNMVRNDVLLHKTAKQLIICSTHARLLYAKMMYVHNIAMQIKGDKQRKHHALSELWKAEQGVFFISSDRGYASAGSAQRTAYKYLLTAEKVARTPGVFNNSLITFDFNFDGVREFLSQRELMNMYVQLPGGLIFEFDIFSSYKNYAAVPRQPGGIFIDYVLSEQDVVHLRENPGHAVPTVFSHTPYQEIGFDPIKHELTLRAEGIFEEFNQPVSLKKQYFFKSEGVQVQYILKNESPLNLSAFFAVEMNLAVHGTDDAAPELVVFSENEKYTAAITRDHFPCISWMRLTDPEGKTVFTIEGNENPDVAITPLCESTSNQYANTDRKSVV